MKILKTLESTTVVFKDGTTAVAKLSDEQFADVFQHQDDEAYIRAIMYPAFAQKVAQVEKIKSVKERILNSNILCYKNESIYMRSVSELTMPEDLAIRILDAEDNDDQELLSTYTNFWTLTSLNPDSRVRKNLFWFLSKYGMTISKSGLFIAYKNADIYEEKSKEADNDSNKEPITLNLFVAKAYPKVKFRLKKSPKNYVVCAFKQGNSSNYFIKKYDAVLDKGVKKLGNLDVMYKALSDSEKNIATPKEKKVDAKPLIFTDRHSHTFKIKIGQIVSMPRTKCDASQDHTCSTGLHVAGKSWLRENYFGNIGLMVLVNPADVVAVPPLDSYGKMRTCAYYPVGVVSFDKDGNIIDPQLSDGFEDDFIEKICYKGQINNEDSDPYKLIIPDMPELDTNRINTRLYEIASTMKNKEIDMKEFNKKRKQSDVSKYDNNQYYCNLVEAVDEI